MKQFDETARTKPIYEELEKLIEELYKSKISLDEKLKDFKGDEREKCALGGMKRGVLNSVTKVKLAYQKIKEDVAKRQILKAQPLFSQGSYISPVEDYCHLFKGQAYMVTEDCDWNENSQNYDRVCLLVNGQPFSVEPGSVKFEMISRRYYH